MLTAYKLVLFENRTPILRIDRTINFELCESGELKFKDSSGIQYVPKEKYCNNEVFEVNEQIFCIADSNNFSESEVLDSLCNYHKKVLNKMVERINKIKYFL